MLPIISSGLPGTPFTAMILSWGPTAWTWDCAEKCSPFQFFKPGQIEGTNAIRRDNIHLIYVQYVRQYTYNYIYKYLYGSIYVYIYIEFYLVFISCVHLALAAVLRDSCHTVASICLCHPHPIPKNNLQQTSRLPSNHLAKYKWKVFTRALLSHQLSILYHIIPSSSQVQ